MCIFKKSFRKRREIVNSIPKDTYYCYEPDEKKNLQSEKKGEYGVFHIKPCRYYKSGKGLFGKCKLYNHEVTDQVKSCGINCNL